MSEREQAKPFPCRAAQADEALKSMRCASSSTAGTLNGYALWKSRPLASADPAARATEACWLLEAERAGSGHAGQARAIRTSSPLVRSVVERRQQRDPGPLVGLSAQPVAQQLPRT